MIENIFGRGIWLEICLGWRGRGGGWRSATLFSIWMYALFLDTQFILFVSSFASISCRVSHSLDYFKNVFRAATPASCITVIISGVPAIVFILFTLFCFSCLLLFLSLFVSSYFVCSTFASISGQFNVARAATTPSHNSFYSVFYSFIFVYYFVIIIIIICNSIFFVSVSPASCVSSMSPEQQHNHHSHHIRDHAGLGFWAYFRVARCLPLLPAGLRRMCPCRLLVHNKSKFCVFFLGERRVGDGLMVG